MLRDCSAPIVRIHAITLIAVATCSNAQASSLTVQGYAVTDLGVGSPSFANTADRLVVVVPGGSTGYAFPQSAGAETSTGPPLIDPAPTFSPGTYGNAANAFAYIRTSQNSQLANFPRLEKVVSGSLFAD